MVPARLRRSGLETRLLIDGAGGDPRRTPDRTLGRLLAQAHRYNAMVMQGRGKTMAELAAGAGVTSSRGSPGFSGSASWRPRSSRRPCVTNIRSSSPPSGSQRIHACLPAGTNSAPCSEMADQRPHSRKECRTWPVGSRGIPMLVKLIRSSVHTPIDLGFGGGRRCDAPTGIRLATREPREGADNTHSHRIRNRR